MRKLFLLLSLILAVFSIGSAQFGISRSAAARIFAAKAQTNMRLWTPTRLRTRDVMTSPPTVTILSSAPYGSSTPTYDTVSSGMVTLVGQSGWTTSGFGTPFSYKPTCRATGASGTTQGAYKILFECAYSDVAFKFYWPTGTTYRIRVDDQYATTDATGPGVSGATRWLRIAFADAKPRRVVIETTAYRIGFNLPSTAGSIIPLAPYGPMVAYFGDSLIDGSSGNQDKYTGWHNTADAMLGWENEWELAIGGSGYLQTTGGYANAAADALAAYLAVETRKPDVVIAAWGHNDLSYTTAQVAAAAAAVFRSMRAAWPDAIIICSGPLFAGGSAGVSSYSAYETAIFAAVSGIVDYTIPQCTGTGRPFFTGSGNTGATTGTGNGDLWVYTDATHFNQLGHDAFARFMAELLRSILLG